MREIRPYLLIIAVILLWGINYIVGRILSAPHSIGGFEFIHISGILYGFFRYFLGSLTMIAVLYFQNKKLSTIKPEIAPIQGMLLLSAFLSAIYILAVHMSQEFISAGMTSIIVNLCPILIFIFGILALHEPFSLKKIIGFSVGSIGGLMFLWDSIDTYQMISIWGTMLALVAMLMWGGYTLTLHYMEGTDRYIVMTVKHVTSAAFTLPFLFLYSINTPIIFVFDIWTVLGILFAGVLASGVAYVLYFQSIELLGTSKVSSFLFLVPFVSILGDFMLGEPLTAVQLIGGIIALMGVALITFRN